MASRKRNSNFYAAFGTTFRAIVSVFKEDDRNFLIIFLFYPQGSIKITKPFVHVQKVLS
jgi:hypothetical protein